MRAASPTSGARLGSTQHLAGDAHASHPPQQRDKLEVDVDEEVDRRVIEGGQVPLERPTAGRLEAEERMAGSRRSVSARR